MRDAAVAYADRGWCVHPLHAGSKRPLTPHGSNDATSDLATVLRWWQPRSYVYEHNVAIQCRESGLVVLDIDERGGGFDTLTWAEAKIGKLPRTVTALSGNGCHYYFKNPGLPLRGKAGNGIDVKDRGYVLVPPSVHPTGRIYQWAPGLAPDQIGLAELPDIWVRNLRSTVPQRIAAPRVQVTGDRLQDIPAVAYIEALTHLEPTRGNRFQCPLHGGGNETDASLICHERDWACFGCEPPPGRQCRGGDIYEFAALLWGFATPLRGTDYEIVRTRLTGLFA